MKLDMKFLCLIFIQTSLFTKIAIAIASESDMPSRELQMCISVGKLEFETIGLSEGLISKSCSCAKRKMGANFPTSESEWNYVGTNSAKKELVGCARKDLLSAYQSIFFSGNAARYQKFGIPDENLRKLSVCQAQGAVNGTYEVAIGNVNATDIRKYVMREFDGCRKYLTRSGG